MQAHQRGFLLGDVLMATLIVGLSAAAVTEVIRAYKRAQQMEDERARAWELAGHIRSLPADFLESLEERGFARLGFPTTDQIRFRVDFAREEKDGLVVLRGKVTYRDSSGEARSLPFQRLLWRGAP